MKNELIGNLKRKQYSNIIKMFLAKISPKLLENISFYKENNRLIKFENPVTIDEKLRVLKCTKYYKNDLVTMCCDKYLVRKYVESKGLAFILNELIGVYTKPEEIGWNALPEKYVLKCNHGSGYNIVVTENNIDENMLSDKLDAWLHENFGILTSEYQYVDISPLIICERYLGDEEGNLPIDYKFFCSRGHMICAMIIVDRGKDITEPVVFVDDKYDEISELSQFANDNFKKMEDYKSTKPKSYESMINYARILSEDFPFVRVDFYEVDGNVIFGELTFTPAGCDFSFLSMQNRIWFGNQISLD